MDGADDGSCTSAERLIYATFFNCLDHLLDLKLTNCHFEFLKLLHYFEETLTGDARQNSAVERWRDQLIFTILVLPEAEEVHGTHLGDIVVQQPEDLIAVVNLETIALGSQRGSVVTSNFLISEAIRPRSDHRGVAIELDGDEAARVVRSDWTQDDEGLCLGDAGEAQFVVHADRCWPDVERVLWLVRYPGFLNFDESSAALKHLISVESRDAKLQMGLVHSAEILVRSKQDHFVVDCSISFRSFEALDRVVQSSVRRIDIEWLVWHNLRGLPASVLQIEVDFEHVIGLDGTEGVDMVGARLFLELCSRLEL